MSNIQYSTVWGLTLIPCRNFWSCSIVMLLVMIRWVLPRSNQIVDMSIVITGNVLSDRPCLTVMRCSSVSPLFGIYPFNLFQELLCVSLSWLMNNSVASFGELRRTLVKCSIECISLSDHCCLIHHKFACSSRRDRYFLQTVALSLQRCASEVYNCRLKISNWTCILFFLFLHLFEHVISSGFSLNFL